jgi:beta-lactam-binding protein with PASTA domain
MKSFDKRLFARNFAVLVALTVVLFFSVDLLIMPFYTRHWQAIEVPDVSYISWTAAKKVLSKKGLKAVHSAEKYDENYPPGFVLFQNPEGGAMVKKGRRVYLSLGRGQRIFSMPRLIGSAERDARFILEENGLRLGNVTYEMDSFYPEDVVSQQSVDPDVDVAIGTVIDLTVSLGVEPDEFIVPSLVGKSKEDAERLTKKAGLTMGRVRYQATNRLVPNTVIRQNIEPGVEVEKGTAIDIVISKLLFREEENLE